MKGKSIEQQLMRWTKPRQKKLLNAITEYNKAVDKWRPYLKDLTPTKASYIYYRRNIKQWNEFQSIIGHLNKFTKYKKPPKIIKTSSGTNVLAWAKNYYEKIMKRANQKRKMKKDTLASKDIYVNGEKIESAKRVALKNEYRPRTKPVESFKTPSSFYEYAKMVEKEIFVKSDLDTARRLRNNIISSINTVYGEDDNISFLLKKLPLSAIQEIYENNQDEFTPMFIYDINYDSDDKTIDIYQSIINSGYYDYLLDIILKNYKKDKKKVKDLLKSMDEIEVMTNFKDIINNKIKLL